MRLRGEVKVRGLPRRPQDVVLRSDPSPRIAARLAPITSHNHILIRIDMTLVLQKAALPAWVCRRAPSKRAVDGARCYFCSATVRRASRTRAN
jgi:hypothetical protein